MQNTADWLHLSREAILTDPSAYSCMGEEHVYFQYDETQTDYLKSKDKKLAGAIDAIGHISFPIEALTAMTDEEIIRELSSLKGIGVWTAEMILIFCMQRPDVVSYSDLAILRGMRMLYRHRKIDKSMFDKLCRRYSPCGSVASLYLWAIAGGAIPGLTDPAKTGSRSEKKKASHSTRVRRR
ncbi:MAG: DNA-3-methyladenine glycosylase family protein [Bilifractor sp.]